MTQTTTADRRIAYRRIATEEAYAPQEVIDEYRRMLNIRMAGPEQLVVNLSGGNQRRSCWRAGWRCVPRC